MVWQGGSDRGGGSLTEGWVWPTQSGLTEGWVWPTKSGLTEGWVWPTKSGLTEEWALCRVWYKAISKVGRSLMMVVFHYGHHCATFKPASGNRHSNFQSPTNHFLISSRKQYILSIKTTAEPQFNIFSLLETFLNQLRLKSTPHWDFQATVFRSIGALKTWPVHHFKAIVT